MEAFVELWCGFAGVKTQCSSWVLWHVPFVHDIGMVCPRFPWAIGGQDSWYVDGLIHGIQD